MCVSYKLAPKAGSNGLYESAHIVPDNDMERLIKAIVLEHKNKRIHLGDIENALKERGINLFADQARHNKFIETINPKQRENDH